MAIFAHTINLLLDVLGTNGTIHHGSLFERRGKKGDAEFFQGNIDTSN